MTFITKRFIKEGLNAVQRRTESGTLQPVLIAEYRQISLQTHEEALEL